MKQPIPLKTNATLTIISASLSVILYLPAFIWALSLAAHSTPDSEQTGQLLGGLVMILICFPIAIMSLTFFIISMVSLVRRSKLSLPTQSALLYTIVLFITGPVLFIAATVPK